MEKKQEIWETLVNEKKNIEKRIKQIEQELNINKKVLNTIKLKQESILNDKPLNKCGSCPEGIKIFCSNGWNCSLCDAGVIY